MCPLNESQALLHGEQLIFKGEGEKNKRDEVEEEIHDGFFGCLQSNKVFAELISLGKLVLPIVMTSLLLHTRSIVSMLFLGHLGRIELAGGALAIAFANITGYSVIKGLAMGMEPICCQAYGAKRWPVLSQTYQKTMFLLTIACLPISLLWLNVEPILKWLGQDPTIVSMARLYLTFSLPDLIAQAHFYPLRIFLRTQNLATPVTVASICALILHFPINYFLVILSNMGVRGVALASAWNTLNLNLALLLYLALSKKMLKPWDSALSILCFQGWQPLIALAVPSVLSVCLEWWWYEVMLLLCGLLSNPQASVAAMGILIQVTGLIYVVPYSLSSGLSTRVGHELGANQPARARLAAIVGLSVAAACGVSAFVFTASVRNILGKVFTSEPQILQLISVALPILGFCELGNCPQTAGCGALTGSARPKVGAKINFTSFYLIGLPVAALLGFAFNIGFVGLWLGLVAAQASCVCMIVYTLARTDWKQQAKRAKELTCDAEGGGEDLEAALLR
ncbi:hypothetical protein Syun_000092 [Stephania yunnanensis]|uniref:Protein DETOXIFICATION n=1 Tax=Stephania yunnanensis TaxID=152371 RepID=A0AAP0LB92_9MAGN